MKLRSVRKKAMAFDIINAGMLSFITFVMVVILAVITLSVLVQSDMVCEDYYDDGGCWKCNGTSTVTYNVSDNLCHDTDSDSTTSGREPAGTAAYNGTMDLRRAANLPAQFGELIVIVLVIVGIIAMVGGIGFAGYKAMKK